MIDKLAEKIAAKIAQRASTDREKLQVEIGIRGGTRRGNFAFGNGEKIFKRLINLARQIKADISDREFVEILNNSPSLRPAVLTWWQNARNPEVKLPLISDLFSSGHLVDDAARMDATISLVAARLPKTNFVTDQLSAIISKLDPTRPWDFYSKAWLLSKYGTDDELIRLIEAAFSLWITQEHLSRVVAGVFPRFRNSRHRAKYQAIIRRASNAWSIGVLQFHLGLVGGTQGYTAIKKFVLAKNSSLPNSITHSKFMMLLSLLSNPDIGPTAVANLRQVHSWALTDPHYQGLI